MPTSKRIKIEEVISNVLPEQMVSFYETLYGNVAPFYVEGHPVVKMVSEELHSKAPSAVWGQVALHIINFFASFSDPSHLHFEVCREIAEKEKAQVADEIIDQFAREVLVQCRYFRDQVIPPDLGKNFDSGLLLVEPRPDCKALMSEMDRMLWLDAKFVRFIEGLGGRAKELAEQIARDAEERFLQWTQQGDLPRAWAIWIDLKKPLSGKFLLPIARTVWESKIKLFHQKFSRNLTAVTQSVHRPLIKFLSPQTKIVTPNGTPTMVHQGEVIAQTAAIDPDLISIVTRGLHQLNSLYHHKLLRLECKMGFENWARGTPDLRVIRFERGETEIAELLGIRSKEAPSIIKSILHAQAFMKFMFEDETAGNLISLSHFRSKATNREEGVEIVLGTRLLPHYTFETSRRSRLLVPLPKFPPLVSPYQYHAGQLLLQMFIMELFTAYSIELRERGSVLIAPSKWEEFFRQSELPKKIFEKTFSRWLVDGKDGGRFLVSVGADRFTLGEEYAKELEFLYAQGKLRKERQKQGSASASKRRKR